MDRFHESTPRGATPRRLSFLRFLGVTALAGMVACAGPAPPTTPDTGSIRAPERLRIRINGHVESVPVETYVAGTALSEVSPVGDTPAVVAGIFRVQAIIARTYAVFHQGRHASEGFDLCDSTHCQVYQPGRLESSRFADAARQAVSDTRGQVLAYGPRAAEALFHADCGGHTVAAEVVWGGRVPYLVGTPDAVPPSTHRPWQYSIERDDLRIALNGSPATAIGASLRSIQVVDRDASGRAARIELVGDTTVTPRGEQVRAAINLRHGALAIRSTLFSLTVNGDTFLFEGTGWGHGVGLCQLGAAARIRRGEPVAAILATYYPGTRLVRAY